MKFSTQNLSWLLALTFGVFTVSAQSFLNGKVWGSISGEKELLIAADVYWKGTATGGITDAKGQFKIPKDKHSSTLIVQYVGFKPDTLEVSNETFIEVVLFPQSDLMEVTVVEEVFTTEIKQLEAEKMVVISERELLKAACCNLSESFETTAAVDVSFTDAITGTKQIMMLGLAGPYTLITRENMPDTRGLAAIFGLEYTPGPWIESMQLTKGAGTVVNGYESVAGQINVELRKPYMGEKLYLNGYANTMGRYEGNLNLSHAMNDKLAMGILLHAKTNAVRNDVNGDGFMDNPVGSNYILVNRWQFMGSKSWHGQAGVKAIYSENTGGQTEYTGTKPDPLSEYWGSYSLNKRIEAWVKLGWASPDRPWKSVGLQVSGLYHDQQSHYGLRAYDAVQKGLYANLISQGIIRNTNNKYKAGVSFMWDTFEEHVLDTLYERNERVPGIFGEYTYTPTELITIVAGMRVDYHNNFGLFATPRVHARYAFNENTTARASFGTARRTASIFAENLSSFTSNRIFYVQGNDLNSPYGLDQEIAWNYGVNLTHQTKIDYRPMTLSLDFYRTDFENQIIVDRETAGEVYFYNLDGKSVSHSLQVQVDYSPLRRLELRMAYRWFDAQADYGGDFLHVPMISPHRWFLNTAYSTKSKWSFDATIQWMSSKRLPNTEANPVEYQIEEYSPSFVTVNGQISKLIGNHWDIYVGVENLLNFRQTEAIVAAQDPFNQAFDAGMVWGPIFGRNIYAGFRYRIQTDEGQN